MQYQFLLIPRPALTNALPTSVALWLMSARASLNPGAEDEHTLQRIAQAWLPESFTDVLWGTDQYSSQLIDCLRLDCTSPGNGNSAHSFCGAGLGLWNSSCVARKN